MSRMREVQVAHRTKSVMRATRVRAGFPEAPSEGDVRPSAGADSVFSWAWIFHNVLRRRDQQDRGTSTRGLFVVSQGSREAPRDLPVTTPGGLES